MDKIKLGDKAKDSITGFTGTVVGITEWIHGCRRIHLQPKVNKEGVIPDSQNFDEPALIIVTPKVIKKRKSRRGGPLNINMKM